MAAAAKTQPIIIKRKGGHGGHHGGAWKVAYADFVTAMMALFIVLWLMNTSKPVQEAISGYFRDPAGTGKLTGLKMLPQPTPLPLPTKQITKENMDKVKSELEKAIRQVANFDKLKEPHRDDGDPRRICASSCWNRRTEPSSTAASPILTATAASC